MPVTHVTRELFGFLEELRRHNNREWFNANKERYLAEVRDPLLAFVAAIGPKLARISPYIVADARPSGSLLRIYRDTDRKSTRLNSSHLVISYAVFCLKKKKKTQNKVTETISVIKRHKRTVCRR